MGRFRKFLLRKTEEYEKKHKDKKKSRAKKIIIRILLILIVLGAAGFFIFRWYQKKQETELTAKEWFYFEVVYLDDMKNLTEQLDVTVSMYLNGNIDEEAYIEQMDMIKSEYVLFIATRDKDKETYHIKPETYDYANKAGPEAAERSYEIVGNLMDDCVNPSIYKDKDKLTYVYLAYTDSLINELATVQSCITAEFYDELTSEEEE